MLSRLLIALALLLAGCRSVEISPGAPPAPAPPPAPAVGEPSGARDAFVVISGGGTPTSNNYSQYVQAHAVAAFFRERYPAEAVWTFFGAGNRAGQPPVLADVYRQVKRDGLLLDTWLVGALPQNRPATREEIVRALRTEILPRVREGGTLYLFLGDHGELTRAKEPESAITLWGLRRDAEHGGHGWSATRNHTLAVTELRQVLAEGLGRGRVVFAMTQCHSGGFHDLGLPALQPAVSWFLSPPGWLGSALKSPPAVAGYTSTDAASPAAGCDPSPDPDTWFGYERFFPEALLGKDLLGSRPAQPPLPSFALAHEAAVLADHTIDRPRSTSEHYLERWATLLETRIANELLLTPRVREALAAYQLAVDTGRFEAPTDTSWQQAYARFDLNIDRMMEQNPRAKPLLTAPRSDLVSVVEGKGPRVLDPEPAGPGEVSLSRRQLQAWRDTLRPAWVKAVAAGDIAALPPAALPFELRIQSMDARRPVGFGDDWSERELAEVYWFSSYSDPAKFAPEVAQAVTRWAAQRRAVLLAWGMASTDVSLRNAAASFPAEFREPRRPSSAPASTSIASSTVAARLLVYRRVLAAWALLLRLDHRPALEQFHALRELERAPLPRWGSPPSTRLH